MNFAYADPPYLGMGKRYAHQHPDALKWNDPSAHQELISSLLAYDAWAMSLSSTSLHVILPMCPGDVRIMAWVKPFAVFKPNVNPAYTWEPVIVRVGRRRSRNEPTIRDYVSANITLKKGVVGAKPPAFCMWLFDVLGARPGDTFHDLFPGSGGVSDAWRKLESGTPTAALEDDK